MCNYRLLVDHCQMQIGIKDVCNWVGIKDIYMYNYRLCGSFPQVVHIP